MEKFKGFFVFAFCIVFNVDSTPYFGRVNDLWVFLGQFRNNFIVNAANRRAISVTLIGATLSSTCMTYPLVCNANARIGSLQLGKLCVSKIVEIRGFKALLKAGSKECAQSM